VFRNSLNINRGREEKNRKAGGRKEKGRRQTEREREREGEGERMNSKIEDKKPISACSQQTRDLENQ
jgi:hypothetical protein